MCPVSKARFKTDKESALFKKVLIANRGEIARRIIRTCRRLGIKTVAVHSDADMFAPFVNEADEAVLIGLAQPHASYLNIEAVLDTAVENKVDAIHPGYGFLSENPIFAIRCAELGIIFVGPAPQTIAAIGEKVIARELMRKAGVSVVAGTRGLVEDPEATLKAAEEIGYPLLIKPNVGGGGIGMTLVETPEKLKAALKTAQSRAQRAFGSSAVFLEKYLPNARHIEFQLLSIIAGRVAIFLSANVRCNVAIRRYWKNRLHRASVKMKRYG